MKAISVNLRRVPLLFYIVSVLVCFVFILLSTAYFADNTDGNKSMLMYMLGGHRSLSALELWHNALSSSDMNTWLLILTPLICCVGYVYTFFIEMSTKCYVFSLNRQGLRRFMLSRFFGCGVYSSVIMLGALLLSLVTCVIYTGRLGSYPYAPISELLIHSQSSFAAAVEVCLTYAVYAFFVGIVCITLAAVISNAFTSCSSLVLILFLCGDIQSSYKSRFMRKLFGGEVTLDEYDHLTDLLFAGNLAHGMPGFQRDLHVPYTVYILALFALMLVLYLIFYFVMKKKVIL